MQIGIDLLLTAEAVALAGDLSQVVKYMVGRQRPYARAGLPNPDTTAREPTTRTSRSIRRTPASPLQSRPPPAPSRACVAIAGRRPFTSRARAIGAATAYLRIAADQHYLTDVMTGAVIGSAVGVGVPLLHRPRRAGRCTLRSFRRRCRGQSRAAAASRIAALW